MFMIVVVVLSFFISYFNMGHLVYECECDKQQQKMHRQQQQQSRIAIVFLLPAPMMIHFWSLP